MRDSAVLLAIFFFFSVDGPSHHRTNGSVHQLTRISEFDQSRKKNFILFLHFSSQPVLALAASALRLLFIYLKLNSIRAQFVSIHLNHRIRESRMGEKKMCLNTFSDFNQRFFFSLCLYFYPILSTFLMLVWTFSRHFFLFFYFLVEKEKKT